MMRSKYAFLLYLLLAALPLVLGFPLISAIFLGTVCAWYTARFDILLPCILVAVLLLISFSFWDLSIGFLLSCAFLPGLTIGICIRKHTSFSFMLMVATLTELVMLVICTLYYARSKNMTPSQLLFGETVRRLSETMQNMSQLDDTVRDQMLRIVGTIKKTLQSMLPFFYIVVSLSFVYMIFVTARFCLRRQEIKIDNMPHFYELSLSGGISTIFIVLFIISLFASSAVLSNVVLIMFFLHVICGISTVDFFLRYKSLPVALRVSILIVMIAVASLFGGIATSVLCFLGMSSRLRNRSIYK